MWDLVPGALTHWKPGQVQSRAFWNWHWWRTANPWQTPWVPSRSTEWLPSGHPHANYGSLKKRGQKYQSVWALMAWAKTGPLLRWESVALRRTWGSTKTISAGCWGMGKNIKLDCRVNTLCLLYLNELNKWHTGKKVRLVGWKCKPKVTAYNDNLPL